MAIPLFNSLKVLVFACAYLVTLCCSHNASAERIFYYEPEISVLAGQVDAKTVWGPPNYGENPATDTKLVIFTVTLEKPIVVKAVSDNSANMTSYKNLRVLQLTYVHSNVTLEKYVGRYCTLTGKLFEGVVGHHFTDVLMAVDSVYCSK